MLPAIREAVLAFGVDRYAELTKRKRFVVIRSIYGRGIGVAAEDFTILCAVVDTETAKRLLNLFMAPLGYRVRTPEEIAADKKQAEKYQRLRDEIIAVLGPDDGRAWLDEHDREIADENARRRAAFEANRYALPEVVQ
jgi:hypothetical protein